MGKPLVVALALALAGGVWVATANAPRRPKLASPAYMIGDSRQGTDAERCLTPAAGLPESLRLPGGGRLGAGWVSVAPGLWLHREGVEVPTLSAVPGLMPVFEFNAVSPRADEVVAVRPTVVMLNVWKNLAPGWCVHRLEVRLDGQPAAAASLNAMGVLSIPLPANLAPGVHGVTVFVEACCGRPEDFTRPSSVRMGHHQVFTWRDSPPEMRVVVGGNWRLRVAFSGHLLPSATDPEAWEVRDPQSGGLLAVRVSQVDAVPGSRDLLLTFEPPLPATEVVLALRWRGQESIALHTPWTSGAAAAAGLAP